jgi:hypothetical protein
LSASSGVELRGGAPLRALQVGIGTVDQLGSIHDREVPSMIDREQYVRHADSGEVTVCCGILECVSKELVTFARQSCEDALPAAEVVARRRMTDAEFDRKGAKAQLVNAIARNDLRGGG